MERPFRLAMALIFAPLCVTFAAPRSAHAADAFPELISFYDLMRLSPADRDGYLEGVRDLLQEISFEDKGRLQFSTDLGPDVHSPRARTENAFFHYLLTVPNAVAAVDDGTVRRKQLLGKTCEQDRAVGYGTTVMCLQAAAGSTNCVCEVTWKDLKDHLQIAGNSDRRDVGCALSSDTNENAALNDDYQSAWIGGSQRCFTRRSLQGYVQNLPANLRASFTEAMQSKEKSKRLATPANDVIDAEDLARGRAQGRPVDPFGTGPVDHVYPSGPADEAKREAGLQREETYNATDIARLLATVTDPKMREQVEKELRRRLDAADESQRRSKEYLQKAFGEARTQIEKAKSNPTPENVAKAEEVVVDAGAAAGGVAAEERAAAELAKQCANSLKATNMPADLREKCQKAAVDSMQAVQEAGDEGTKILAEGRALLNDPKVKEALAQAGTESKALQDALANLEAAIKSGDREKIAEAERAARAALEKLGTKLSLTPDKRAELETIACLEKGKFACLKNQGKGRADFAKARDNYLATHGEDAQKCIFGGNASRMSTDAESRNGTKRPGCAAVKNFEFENAQGKQTISCPPDTGNHKYVLCNPMLFGVDKDAGGKLVGRCADWTSVVTLDCNFRYPARATRGAGVSAGAFLSDATNKLESRWKDLADVINKRCNVAAFRVLHCDECQVIADRLAALKAKVTSGSCQWPSELPTVRDQIGQPAAQRRAAPTRPVK